MMKSISLASVLVILATAPLIGASAPDLAAEAATVTIGQHLQAFTRIRLAKPAPQGGDVEVTVTSDDPSRLLLSSSEDKAGSASITLKIPAQAIRSREFALQGLAASGSVTYTISAPGLESAKGTVTLTSYTIVILGPHKAPKIQTTPRGDPGTLTIVTAFLDAEGKKILGDQELAGGSQLEVQISNSHPDILKLRDSKLIISGGYRIATTSFLPAAEGETTIGPVQPAGFTTPPDRASITVAVATPNLAIAGDLFLGKDLQTPAAIVLGEPAPPGGLNVTLKSADPSRLLLAAKEDETGSAAVTIAIPAGARNAPYVIQGLGDSGEVEYSAAAPGYRSRSGKVKLTASGVILAYEAYGPPAEGNVKRRIGAHKDAQFFVSLADAKANPVHLVVYSAYIDRETGRAADFTVQPLRAGVTATVTLKSSNPEVATIESPLTIKPGFNRAVCLFTPSAPGSAVITVDTPSGFSTPQNAVAVSATIKE
jgi:hypothetical protein